MTGHFSGRELALSQGDEAMKSLLLIVLPWNGKNHQQQPLPTCYSAQYIRRTRHVLGHQLSDLKDLLGIGNFTEHGVVVEWIKAENFGVMLCNLQTTVITANKFPFLQAKIINNSQSCTTDVYGQRSSPWKRSVRHEDMFFGGLSSEWNITQQQRLSSTLIGDAQLMASALQKK